VKRPELEFEGRGWRWRPKISILSLLTATSFFLSSAWFYYNYIYFQWTHHNSHLDDLVYLKDCPPEHLNGFAADTLVATIEPLEHLAAEIKGARTATLKNSSWCFTQRRDLEPIREELLSIMSDARLRRIPTVYRKRYHDVLLAVRDLYYSVNAIEEIYLGPTDSDRDRAYKMSLMQWKQAEKRLQRARDYFQRPSPHRSVSTPSIGNHPG